MALKAYDFHYKQKSLCFIFELHSLAYFNSLLAAIMLGIDYALIIILVIYVRIVDMAGRSEDFFMTHLQITKFENDVLYDSVVSLMLNLILTLTMLALVIMVLTTDPEKPRKRRDSWKLKGLLLIMYFFNTAISNVVIYSQLVCIQCQWGYPNFSCISKESTLRITMSCIGIVMMLLNSFYLENIYNYQFMGINMQRSILSNYRFLSLLPMVLKYVNIFIYISTFSDIITSTMFICAALIYLVILYLRFNQSFYFAKILADVEVIGLALCFYNYIISVSINMLHYQVTNGDFFIAFGMNFIVGLFTYILRKYLWVNKLNQEFIGIKNKASKEVYAYRMLDCILDNTFENQLILNGMLKLHKLSCTNLKCRCNFEKMMSMITDQAHKQLLVKYKTEDLSTTQDLQGYLDNQNNTDEQQGYVNYQGSLTKLKTQQQLYYLLVLSNWLELSFQTQGNHRMRIIQSYLLSDLLDKDLKALYLISTLQNYKLLISEKIAIFCYQKLIFEKVNNRVKSLTSQSLEVQFVMKWMKTENKITEFNENIEITKNLCYSLWKTIQFKDQSFNFDETQKIAFKIVQQCAVVENIYGSIRKLVPDFTLIIATFHKFLKYIMNHDYEAMKEAEILASLYQKRNLRNLKQTEVIDDIFDINGNVGVILVSCSKKLLGQIIFANKEICEMTQNNIERIKNRQIQAIIPSVINEEDHLKKIQNFFLHKTKSQFINKKQKLWIKDRDGFIILVDFYTQPFYEQQKGLQMIAFIQKVQKLEIKEQIVDQGDINTFITNQNGVISHSCRKFARLFEFSNVQDMERADMSIFDICPGIISDSISKKLSEDIQKGIEVEIMLSEYTEFIPGFDNMRDFNLRMNDRNEEFSMYTAPVNNNDMNSNNYSLSEQFPSSISILKQPQQSRNDSQFQFSKQKKVKINIKADLRYQQTKHAFSVFYFAIIDRNKHKNKQFGIHELAIKDETETAQHVGSSNSASQTSQSGTNSTNQIQRIKYNEIKLVPRLVGLFKRIFVIYFMIFAALSTAMIIISYQGTTKYLNDFEQYNLTSEFVSSLLYIRVQYRMLLSTIKFNEKSLKNTTVVEDLSFRKRIILEELGVASEYLNQINSYLLQNQDDSQLYQYSYILKSKEIITNGIKTNGQIEKGSSSLLGGITSIISSLTQFLSLGFEDLICDCNFRGNLTGKTYSDLQRFTFSLMNNSIDVLDSQIHQAILEIEKAILTKADQLQSKLLYFTIPSMILSILCSVAFFPVVIRTLNNSFKIIQMLSQLSQKSATQCLENIETFDRLIHEENIQSNTNKQQQKQQMTVEEEEEELKENDEYRNQMHNRKRNSKDQNIEQIIQDTKIQQEQNFKPAINNPKSKKNAAIPEDENKISSIEEQINKKFVMKKIYSTVKLIALSGILCTFFIAMYFLNIQPLVQVNENVRMIRIYNERQQCLEGLYTFIFESIIQNRTLKSGLLSDTIDGIFDYCNYNLQQITVLRRQSLETLADLDSYLSDLEGQKICSYIDQSNLKYSNYSFIQKCNKVQNGILLKGITISYSYLLGELRSYYNQFLKSNRTEKSLNELLQSTRYQDDDYKMLQIYLRPTFNEQLLQFTNTFLSYYKSLMIRPIIFFTMFLIFLLVTILVIIFYILKEIQNEAYYNQKLIKFIPNEELLSKKIAKIIKSIKY